MRVEKIWGREDILVNDSEANYCCKRMTVRPGYRCSIHMHAIKDETFLVTKGWLHVATWPVGADPMVSEPTKKTLRPGDKIRILPGQAHTFWSHVESEFLEVSTSDSSADSIRMDSSRAIDNNWRGAWSQWPGRFSFLVIGDMMVDKYMPVQVRGPSAETPSLIMSHAGDELLLPGGAANTASVLAFFGSKVAIVGSVGHDSDGDWLVNELKERGIDTSLIVRQSGFTTVKTRYACGPTQVFRTDRDRSPGMCPGEGRGIADSLGSTSPEKFDAVVISDYGKGVVLSKCVAKELATRWTPRVKSYCDPSLACMKDRVLFSAFGAFTVVKQNLRNFRDAMGDPCMSAVSAARGGVEAGWAQSCIVTDGGNGSVSWSTRNGERTFAVPEELSGSPVDVTGAGDEFLAITALEDIATGSLDVACTTATRWSSQQVRRTWHRRTTQDSAP